MRIIPAIDLIGGRCVRLSQGDYQRQKVYDEQPLELAKRFADHGLRYLHVVDLDGAKSAHVVNHKTLSLLAEQSGLQIDFGGGIKSREDLRIAFDCGAAQITGGSIALKQPQEFLSWLAEYGAERIILGADCQNRRIAAQGWLEQSEQEVLPFVADYQAKGLDYVICTDIAKDGMLAGPSFELYAELLAHCPGIKLIASGGIHSLADLDRLQALGCEGAIIGKALFEGHISLKDLSAWVEKQGA